MQRKTLSMITLTLIALIAQTCYAADPPALLSTAEVNHHGLERAWYSQIAIDGRLAKIEHTLLDRNSFFVVTNNNDLIALDAETGQTLWTRYLGISGMMPFSPAANSRTVAVACGSEIQIFDRRNGRLLWHQVLPAAASAACQLTDYYLYVPMVDSRMACFPLEELKAPSPELLALVPQYKAIGYTLDPYSGKVTKSSRQTVSTGEFVKSQQGEKKPAPSQRLLELVPEYAKIGMVLDPYTGEVREADKTTASWWRNNMMETNAPLKGKMELDGLLDEELMRLDRNRRQGRSVDSSDETDADNAPFFLKPHKSVPMFCYSFGTTMVQPVISFDSARLEVLTWFTDRGYLFFAEALHDKELTVKMTGDWTEDKDSNTYVAKAKRVAFGMTQGDDFSIYVPDASEREAPLQKVGDRVGVIYRGRWEMVGAGEGGYDTTQGTTVSNTSFVLHHRVAVSPVLSYKKDTKTKIYEALVARKSTLSRGGSGTMVKASHYEGSIARDIVFQPAIVQKNIMNPDDHTSQFLTVVGSASGLVFAYDSKTRETRWSQSVGSPVKNHITVVRDRIYVPCMNGNLWCLDSNNGDVLWISPGIDSFIAASPDWLYVKNSSGDLTRVNCRDGAQRTLFSLRAYKEVYYNNENDRIFLITNSGLIQCLHEPQYETPARHTYLPEAYLDYKETDKERRFLTEMPAIANGVRKQPRQTPKEGTQRQTHDPDDTDNTPVDDGGVSAPDSGGFGGGFSTPVTTTPAQPQNPTQVDDDWGIDFEDTEF